SSFISTPLSSVCATEGPGASSNKSGKLNSSSSLSSSLATSARWIGELVVGAGRSAAAMARWREEDWRLEIGDWGLGYWRLEIGDWVVCWLDGWCVVVVVSKVCRWLVVGVVVVI